MSYAWDAFKHFAPGLAIGLFVGAIANLIIVLYMIEPAEPETRCFVLADHSENYCRSQREW